MRDIRFKAKRLDNGELVEGDLSHEVYRTNGDYLNYTTICTPIKNNHGETMAHTIYKVDPSTVCQFTGLKDKNGKEIWEHDIVKDGSLTMVVAFEDGMFMASGYLLYTLIENISVIGNEFNRKEGECQH